MIYVASRVKHAGMWRELREELQINSTFPTKLIEPCIKAGCPEGGIVLDPFSGSGTTVATAKILGRRGIGLELSEEYMGLARKRIAESFREKRGKMKESAAGQSKWGWETEK